MPRTREEAIAAGVTIAETKHSMKRRKSWHDYHQKGTYMLTLVVDGRAPVLGRLVMGSEAESAHIELSTLGKAICDEEVQKIPTFYKMVEVWKLCIMPDHIHMIVRVKENMPEGKHLGQVVAGFKGGCSRAWWRMSKPCSDEQGVVTPAVSSATTSAPSSATTPPASAAGASAGLPPLFESGYNDQILLEDGQLDNWLHYLDDNPRRLAIKRLHPDYFTTMHYRDIAEWHCQLVGNSFLLDIPDMEAVIVHSAYSAAPSHVSNAWCSTGWLRPSHSCTNTKKQRKIWQNKKKVVPLQPQYALIVNNR